MKIYAISHTIDVVIYTMFLWAGTV